MVRDAYKRINKYIAKLDPEINKKRYDALKEQMIENYFSYAREIWRLKYIYAGIIL